MYKSHSARQPFIHYHLSFTLHQPFYPLSIIIYALESR